MANLIWPNLKLDGPFAVTYKTREDFRTKTGKSRTVPLDPALAAKLKAWHEKNPDSTPVFPTDEGQVEGHFLRICKAVAVQAGLDPQKFYLQVSGHVRNLGVTPWG
jgi:integrase